MADGLFQTLERSALEAELEKMGHLLEPGELDALAELGVVPSTTGRVDALPLAALSLVVSGIAFRGGAQLELLRSRARDFVEASAGEPSALERVHRTLRETLAERAVLGELHRMLPVLEGSALDTLRGDARLEWRIRQALIEVNALIASDRFRDDTATPMMARPSAVPRVSRQPEVDVVDAAADDDIRGETDGPWSYSGAAPGVGPYELGPEDRHPRGFRAQPQARMPTLSESNDVLPAPPTPSEHAPFALFDDTATFLDHQDRVGARDEDDFEDEGWGQPRAGKYDTSEGMGVGGAADDSINPDEAETGSEDAVITQAQPVVRGPGPRSALEHARQAALRRGESSAPPRPVVPEAPALEGRPIIDEHRSATRPAGNEQVFELPEPLAHITAEYEPVSEPPFPEAPLSEPPDREHLRPESRTSDVSAAALLDSVDLEPIDSVEFPRARSASDDLPTGAWSRSESGASEPVEEGRITPTSEEALVDVASPAVLSDAVVTPPAGEAASRSRSSSNAAVSASQSGARTRMARQSAALFDAAELGGSGSGSSSIEIQRKAGSPLDVASVLRDPEATFERASQALDADPENMRAQDELVALLGSSDDALAERAWGRVEPALRATPARAQALFGALVVMAGRAQDDAQRSRLLIEAGDLALTGDYDDPRQAFELFMEAVRLDPTDEVAVERATDCVDAQGWWDEFVTLASEAARDASEPERVSALSRLAGDSARLKLRDDVRAAAIYEALVQRGIYDADAVAALIDIYARDGRSSDTLILLLRCADMLDGDERAERLARAADVCVEELHDTDRALTIYEKTMQRDELESVRERYIELARRTGQVERALRTLGGESKDFDASMVRAKLAREWFDDAGLERRELSRAFGAPDADVLVAGFALADADRAADDLAGEADTLESMLGVLEPGEEQLAVVRRLASVYAAGTDGDERAIGLYREAVETGAFDPPLVQSLVALLTSTGRQAEVLDVLRTAGERAAEPADATTYLREFAARVRADVEDPDEAIALLEEAADRSGGDPEVLFAMAETFRQVGDAVSEMSALEQAVLSEAAAPGAAALVRLTELQLSRPRGATRGAELLHRVLDAPPIDPAVEPRLATLVPEVAERAGDLALQLRWSERAAARADSPADVLGHLRVVIRAQARLEVDPEARVKTCERALVTAEEAGEPAAEVAGLHLDAARARMALGHWNGAVDHAANCARTFLDDDPDQPHCVRAVELVVELSELVVDERPALVLLSEAAATGYLPHRAAYARALVKLERWDEAHAVLAPLAERVDPDSPLGERVRADYELVESKARP